MKKKGPTPTFDPRTEIQFLQTLCSEFMTDEPLKTYTIKEPALMGFFRKSLKYKAPS